VDVLVRNALLLETTMNGAFWTLQVEVFGSLLVLVAFLLERRYKLWPVVALTAFLLPLSFLGREKLVAGIDTAMLYPFLVGYLIAARPWQFGSERHALGILCAAVVVFFGASAAGYVLKQWLLLLTVASSAGIILVLSSVPYRDSLSWFPLRMLGLWSYSFYALHPLGLRVAGSLSGQLEAAGVSSPIASVILLLVPVIVTILVAAPSFYWIERPGLALGSRVRRVITRPENLVAQQKQATS